MGERGYTFEKTECYLAKVRELVWLQRGGVLRSERGLTDLRSPFG